MKMLMTSSPQKTVRVTVCVHARVCAGQGLGRCFRES